MVGMAVSLSAVTSWGVRRFNSLADHLATTVPWPPGMSETDFVAKVTRESLHVVFGEFFVIAAIVLALAVVPALFLYKHRARGTGRAPFLPH
jgi:hypothetical protein